MSPAAQLSVDRMTSPDSQPGSRFRVPTFKSNGILPTKALFHTEAQEPNRPKCQRSVAPQGSQEQSQTTCRCTANIS
jgi:hypothetical protein